MHKQAFSRSSALTLLLAFPAALLLWREANTGSVAFAQTPTLPANSDRSGQKSPSTLDRDITRVLRTQQAAWNRGDLEAFMEPYLKSKELTFSSGGKVTRGWQATLEGYRKRYPDRAAMGQLEFSGLEFRPLGDTAALVLGNWQLERVEQEDVGGNFTLVLQKIDGKWLIVHDHTSRSEAAM